MQQPAAYNQILDCATPQAWLEYAVTQLAVLLIDHAQCEKKAATTAINLLYRYPDRTELLFKMSSLAREELLHFDKVIKLLQSRGFSYQHLPAGRYAQGLLAYRSNHEPDRLIDQLIIGAFIEARSCERFASLLPLLDDELAMFYRHLVKAEARHFEDYLALARSYAEGDIDGRITYFANIEAELIQSQDPLFRFHSGVPPA